MSKLHLTTCADSLKALEEFIVYLAEDGDLPKTEPAAPVVETAQVDPQVSLASASNLPISSLSLTYL